jgi:hypothetical protein
MALYPEDKRAAFIGMIVTTIALLVLTLVVVEFTNRQFAGHAQEKGAPTKQH